MNMNQIKEPYRPVGRLIYEYVEKEMGILLGDVPDASEDQKKVFALEILDEFDSWTDNLRRQIKAVRVPVRQ